MLFSKRVVSARELADRAHQKGLKDSLHRSLVVEDLTEMESQFIVRVQAYYRNRDSFTLEEQAELERELSNVRQTLATARSVIEQLVRASNGQAYVNK